MADLTVAVVPLVLGLSIAVEARGTLGPVGLGRDDIQAFATPNPQNTGSVTFSFAAEFQQSASNALTVTGDALEAQQSSSGYTWFDHFHIIPRSITLGNVASDVTVAITVFSAHRRISEAWTAFTNNAGVGTVLNGEPIFPETIPPFGVFAGVALAVDSNGAPFVNATLDFTFGSEVILLPVTLQRLSMWITKPERKYSELLEWLTTIYKARSGKEKRERLRGSPRVTYRYNFRMLDSAPDRQYTENLIFSRQSINIGMPLWKHQTFLTSPVVATDTVLNVVSTSFRDFRVGAPVVIFASGDTRSFDTHEILSLTATTITLVTPMSNPYATGLEVYPVQVCDMSPAAGGARWTVGLTSFQVEFGVIDNDLNIGSLVAFNSYLTRLLMDQGNLMGGTTKRESHAIDVFDADSLTGVSVRTTNWPNSRRSSPLTLYTSGHQQEWETRQMFYALAGRQASFEYPRAGPDFVATVAIASSSVLLQIENVGYTQFVNAVQPKNTLRVNKTDGSSLIREIVSTTELSLTQELLTVNSNWGENVAIADIESIEYVERARLDNDTLEIQHDINGSTARFQTSLRSVLE